MARVLVPLAEGCEELEAVTIIDLLRRAGIEVTSAGLRPGPVRASRGTVLLPDATLDDAAKYDYDMVVLPGGLPGADYLRKDGRVRAMLTRTVERGKFVAAICAAPRVLAEAGLLTGKRATGFPGTLDGVIGVNLRPEPVVRDGLIVTSRGPGTAMDFALELIELLSSRAKRDEVEAALQRPGK
ncbi:MAG: DJ-1 family glyoxalase III [Pseudomonadota bacterium]